MTCLFLNCEFSCYGKCQLFSFQHMCIFSPASVVCRCVGCLFTWVVSPAEKMLWILRNLTEHFCSVSPVNLWCRGSVVRDSLFDQCLYYILWIFVLYMLYLCLVIKLLWTNNIHTELYTLSLYKSIYFLEFLASFMKLFLIKMFRWDGKCWRLTAVFLHLKQIFYSYFF